MTAQEQDMDIQIIEETVDPLLVEQDTEKYFLKSKIDLKHDFVSSEDKADKAFYHQLANCESVSSLSDVKIKEEIEDEDEYARYESNTSQEFVFVKCEPQSSDVEDGDPNNTSEYSTEETSDNKQYAHCESVSTLLDVKDGGLSGISKDQNQNSDSIHKCTICNKQFTRREYLLRHIKLHAGVKKYNCSECSKYFTRKLNLVRHMKTHIGVKEFNCSDCSKPFSRKEDLIRHMKFHSGIKEFSCSVCNKQFSQKGNLTTHMNWHSREKIYECTICDKKYFLKDSLKFHIKTHH